MLTDENVQYLELISNSPSVKERVIKFTIIKSDQLLGIVII